MVIREVLPKKAMLKQRPGGGEGAAGAIGLSEQPGGGLRGWREGEGEIEEVESREGEATS